MFRWDISTLDHLPEYMRVCYQALFDVYSEIEEEMTKAGRPYRLQYAKDSVSGTRTSKIYSINLMTIFLHLLLH